MRSSDKWPVLHTWGSQNNPDSEGDQTAWNVRAIPTAALLGAIFPKASPEREEKKHKEGKWVLWLTAMCSVSTCTSSLMGLFKPFRVYRVFPPPLKFTPLWSVFCQDCVEPKKTQTEELNPTGVWCVSAGENWNGSSKLLEAQDPPETGST